ncbi:hypothetical protein K6Q96_16695 [Grimontia kaedaensis]|uniref:Uncharacterized protein n=1 Tax=Grimontia kaedaensis TaxID=2872157 RepID=A0ABY4WS65_9GAMM|nr:hypothetical protein [Grimontia kaedaensis]USH02447.1 hypothetical protein K6Q96_16695 [Grimontia kaedaensis]
MRPATVRPVRVNRTPSRMRAHFFAPVFKSKTNTNMNGTPDLTLVRPTPVVVEMPEGEAA